MVDLDYSISEIDAFMRMYEEDFVKYGSGSLNYNCLKGIDRNISIIRDVNPELADNIQQRVNQTINSLYDTYRR